MTNKKSPDGRHCVHWFDGEKCCFCGDDAPDDCETACGRPPLTADTITDEQIRELRSSSRRARRGERNTGLGVRNLCDIALHHDGYPANVVHRARGECAEILNARASVKP